MTGRNVRGCVRRARDRCVTGAAVRQRGRHGVGWYPVSLALYATCLVAVPPCAVVAGLHVLAQHAPRLSLCVTPPYHRVHHVFRHVSHHHTTVCGSGGVLRVDPPTRPLQRCGMLPCRPGMAAPCSLPMVTWVRRARTHTLSPVPLRGCKLSNSTLSRYKQSNCCPCLFRSLPNNSK